MECIFCDQENTAKSIEHIVSEAFGNKSYVAQRGRVCDDCNNRFSKFEGTALSNSVFVMERARLGIATKKGKNAKGKVDNLEIAGHEEFEKNLITIKGLTDDNFIAFDPDTKTGKLYVKSFDKSEVAASKLLLKMALSSIFTSQRELFNKYDFTNLKRFLTNKDNADWPFMTSGYEIGKFQSIPRFTDKFNLGKVRCSLRYFEMDENTLLFMFTYGAVSMVINLLNRNLEWIESYSNSDSVSSLYPEHFRKKTVTEKRIVANGSKQ
ncbi:HNH endonuclease [Lacibacter sediminis]|uniref:HNH endonuclease 5 domain-containing protein n=1 Tax=Lacibacter sediminis TaxID=2760713 RepID=A0A7G5XB22_9BACT|nr:HNH endonuclease [Lacibacter sediminis]QNA42675.1 hypothetical protein H4075_11200 [Lacibacter sediminis]